MKIENQELHRIALTAIIYNEKGEYLLLKRSMEKKAFPGQWTVPGGGLETNDYTDTPQTTNDHWYNAVENALRREIKEESNVDVGKLKFLLDIAFIRPDGIPVIILSYHAPYLNGEVKLDEDSTEYAWVTYGEAKKYDMVEGLIDEIEMVDNIISQIDK